MSHKYADRDPSEEILRAFKLFDEDGRGKISLKNLKKIAKELGEGLSDDELQAMIDEFDKDQDGYSTIFSLIIVNEEEFMGIMKQSTNYL